MKWLPIISWDCSVPLSNIILRRGIKRVCCSCRGLKFSSSSTCVYSQPPSEGSASEDPIHSSGLLQESKYMWKYANIFQNKNKIDLLKNTDLICLIGLNLRSTFSFPLFVSYFQSFVKDYLDAEQFHEQTYNHHWEHIIMQCVAKTPDSASITTVYISVFFISSYNLRQHI